MLEKKVTVHLKNGLHARPAAQFVKTATSFKSSISITKDKDYINAKSVMGVMALAVTKGEEVIILADGPDENEAITTLEEFLIGGDND